MTPEERKLLVTIAKVLHGAVSGAHVHYRVKMLDLDQLERTLAPFLSNSEIEDTRG
jgi:flagellar biosynthesis/type III secretory pathway protein FliH